MSEQFKRYSVGDKVEVRNPSVALPLTGQVVEVVPAGKYPDPKFFGVFRRGKQLATRLTESYVVEIDGMSKSNKDRFRWPKASWLSPVATATPVVTPAPTTKVTPAQTQTEVQTKTETLPDGTKITTTTTITKEVPAKTKRLLTEFVFVVDASGSMVPWKNRVVPAVMTKIRGIAAAATQANMPQPRITIYLFEGGNITVVVDRQPADKVTNFTYYTAGDTNLFDTIGEATSSQRIAEAIKEAQASGDEVSFVLEAITDGQENHTTKYNTLILGSLFKERIADGNWTFAFQVPGKHLGGSSYKSALLYMFPMIPADNILEWSQDEAGFKYAMNSATFAATSYTSTRGATGARASSSYYVQPNLSTVTSSQLAKMTDLSHKFKLHTVGSECEIKTYIEGKTGAPYVIGSAYYQLTKKEKVGGDKEVLIRDKATKRVYGGDEARKAIGLPDKTSNVDSKIEPGNHANFDIFLESRSPNRHLVRGSILLHDVTMSVGKTPTFDLSVLQPKPVTP